MNFCVLGQGTALPEYSIEYKEAAEYATRVSCHSDEHRRVLPALYRMSGVRRRYSVLLEKPDGEPERQSFFPYPENGTDLGPTIGPRMEQYEHFAITLAQQAAQRALDAAGTAPDAISHVVTVSCSGFAAPGVDVAIIKGLGLASTTQRVHVGFMGCHGALNGLRAARGLAAAEPDAHVLVCAVEVCSLHYHYGWDPEQIVANALFADGAAAVIAGPENGAADSAWRVAATGSCLIPDSEDAMTWRVRDHGFVMSLSPRVPDLIGSYLRPWVEDWLGRHGLGVDSVATWAVHPGGPRILSATAEALGLAKDALATSRDILREYGNMSSPTILFIIDRLRAQRAPLPCVALGFGPGLMAEAVLFT